MYVYIKSEPSLWTVGFYDPQGKWHPQSDYEVREEAAGRVAWLNGSGMVENPYHLTGDELEDAEKQAKQR